MFLGFFPPFATNIGHESELGQVKIVTLRFKCMIYFQLGVYASLSSLKIAWTWSSPLCPQGSKSQQSATAAVGASAGTAVKYLQNPQDSSNWERNPAAHLEVIAGSGMGRTDNKEFYRKALTDEIL